MTYQIATYLLAAALVVQTIRVFSLLFRHSYLRQKLLNRMDKSEIEQMNKTDLNFWSFLK
jgi:ABC-type nickel/cobalt efflux system permease component RcnA